jgi:hypothetical protein
MKAAMVLVGFLMAGGASVGLAGVAQAATPSVSPATCSTLPAIKVGPGINITLHVSHHRIIETGHTNLTVDGNGNCIKSTDSNLTVNGNNNYITAASSVVNITGTGDFFQSGGGNDVNCGHNHANLRSTDAATACIA